jgi:hypothetical protein
MSHLRHTADVLLRFSSTEPDPQHPHRPKIQFGGDVDGHATMVGHVSLGPDDGHIRWSFVSGEQDRPLWR